MKNNQLKMVKGSSKKAVTPQPKKQEKPVEKLPAKKGLETFREAMTMADFYKWVKSKEMTLSHSAFSNFGGENGTPDKFVQYKLKANRPSEAMIKGVLEHKALLEPDKLESSYFIAPKVARTSNKGKIEHIDFLKKVCSEKGMTAEQFNEGDAIDNLKEMYDFYLLHCEKWVIKIEWLQFAERMVQKVYRNNTASWLLDQCDTFEQGEKWDAFGFKWRGFIDMIGPNVIADLKKVPDASTRKMYWTIKDRQIPTQFAHYTHGAGNMGKDSFVLAFDGQLNINVIEIPAKTIADNWENLRNDVRKFKSCIFTGDWGQSYNYKAKGAFGQNIYTGY